MEKRPTYTYRMGEVEIVESSDGVIEFEPTYMDQLAALREIAERMAGDEDPEPEPPAPKPGKRHETPAERNDRLVTNAIFDLVEFERLDGDAVLSRSAGTPAQVHYVTTETSCTCPGYQRHGYCKHNALLRWMRSFDVAPVDVAAA